MNSSAVPSMVGPKRCVRQQLGGCETVVQLADLDFLGSDAGLFADGCRRRFRRVEPTSLRMECSSRVLGKPVVIGAPLMLMAFVMPCLAIGARRRGAIPPRPTPCEGIFESCPSVVFPYRDPHRRTKACCLYAGCSGAHAQILPRSPNALRTEVGPAERLRECPNCVCSALSRRFADRLDGSRSQMRKARAKIPSSPAP